MTHEQYVVKDFLAGVPNLVAGLGDERAMCSMAAISLALTGELSDSPVQCASRVIWRWGIRIQDSMPSSRRNSTEWREALCYIPGTGRESAKDRQRLDLIMAWMWEQVLPHLISVAKAGGYIDKWQKMLSERRHEAAAANAASYVAATAADYTHAAACHLHAADAASNAAAARAHADDIASAAAAADASDAASYVAAATANASDAAASAAVSAASASAAVYAATAAAAAADTFAAQSAAANRLDYWRAVDPAGLLRRLCEV